MSRRTERFSEQVRAELARLLREEVTDPRIRLVTLMRVDVSPDFANARVYWSSLEANDREAPPEVEEGLDSAAPFLRRQLARHLPQKRVPELHFHYDPSMVLASQTSNLLRGIRDDTEGAS